MVLKPKTLFFVHTSYSLTRTMAIFRFTVDSLIVSSENTSGYLNSFHQHRIRSIQESHHYSSQCTDIPTCYTTKSKKNIYNIYIIRHCWLPGPQTKSSSSSSMMSSSSWVEYPHSFNQGLFRSGVFPALFCVLREACRNMRRCGGVLV